MPDDVKKILIVDDEPDIVELLSSVLLSEGYAVDTACDGEQALKRIESNEPHLILLDMNMPKMGGVGFYHHIYDSKRERPKYPVMFLTGRGEMESLFRDLHVDGFLTKPFDLSRLLSEVKNIMVRRYDTTHHEQKPPSDRPKVPAHILIVEKDSQMLADLTVTFLNSGYLVNYAGAAAKAEEKAKHDQPDLLLIRVDLPDMAGDMLARRLSDVQNLKSVPVVLYAPSADVYEKDLTHDICRKLGLRNPVITSDPSALLRICNQTLEYHRAA